LSASPRYYAAASASFVEELKSAGADFSESFKTTRIWYALGLNDIAARYRGSLLGPFWITLTTAVFVLGIGFLYAGLMKVSIDRYLPWMTTGLVVWGLISQTVLEGGDAFISAGNVMRQTRLPAPLFVWRVVWRNVLTFAHQLPVLIVLAVKFNYLTRINLPEAAAGLVLVVLNISWFALVCAMVCARFRDIKQILASLTQLLFFLSPVLWLPGDMRGFGGKLMALNPVVHMLNVLRGPLLGQGLSLFSTTFLAVAAIAGWLLTILFFARVRRRIVHYV
jgi:lipopolysaccharide transport system permease protein